MAIMVGSPTPFAGQNCGASGESTRVSSEPLRSAPL